MSSKGGLGDSESENQLPPYAGTAEVEEFQVSGEDITEMVDYIEALPGSDNVEVLYEGDEHWAVEYTPTRADAEASSERNNDYNILHQYSGLVESFFEEFEYAEEIERDVEAVISQGRNISDILAAMYDKPVKRTEGSWDSPVLAVEEGTGEPDEVIVSTAWNGESDYIATNFPGGNTDEAEEAASFKAEFFEDYDEETNFQAHNAMMTSLGNFVVGRGAPEERNTELLQTTKTAVDQILEPDKVEELDFQRDDELAEDSHGDGYHAKVEYENGGEASVELSENAFPAVEPFKHMPNVEEFRNRSIDEGESETEKASPIATTIRASSSFINTSLKLQNALLKASLPNYKQIKSKSNADAD